MSSEALTLTLAETWEKMPPFNPLDLCSPPHCHRHVHLPTLPGPPTDPPHAGGPLTAGLQLCGEDLGFLYPDLVDAGVLGPQVLDLEVIVFSQPPHTALGLAVGTVGDHLTILRPGETGGLRASVGPPNLLPQSHAGSSQRLSPTGPGMGDIFLGLKGVGAGERSGWGGEQAGREANPPGMCTALTTGSNYLPINYLPNI